ncbi:hypothetical protein BU15DRAFT_68373 [Melanogaster broomeanus]|nr:hypothetical protein BU15DRAFT_68373 [Melanogaster broomeanus]
MQHPNCASTSHTHIDSSKRTALIVDSLESDHTDDEGRHKDMPGQSYDGSPQANSHAASVLEVPDKEDDSPANGRVGRQGATSGSMPDHKRMQGTDHEVQNDLESAQMISRPIPQDGAESAQTIPRPIRSQDGAESGEFLCGISYEMMRAHHEPAHLCDSSHDNHAATQTTTL